MVLADVLMGIVLVGLALYVVLAGADFGAPLWQVTAGRGEHAEEIREHAHAGMAPVWEANHVWLIFVITVLWTAFPVALGSLASTLVVPLFIAAVGIIIRGAAYALRAATSSRRQLEAVDMVSAVSSVLTPLALGMAVGGIASRRVPVGNAAGGLIASWVNPTSVAIGVLSVATSTYLAAVFLTADAVRRDEPELERAFRARALGAGAVTGALAIAGVVVLGFDATGLFDDLVRGAGLPGLVVSALAGVATIGLLWTRRFEAARYVSALAVAAIIASWALAQDPVILPGLTIERAAAPQDVLVAVLVAVVAGGAVLFPSLVLLFRLALGGRLAEREGGHVTAARGRDLLTVSSPGLLGRTAIACLLAGIGLLTIAGAGWAHGVGVAALVGFVVLGFAAAIPALLPTADQQAGPATDAASRTDGSG